MDSNLQDLLLVFPSCLSLSLLNILFFFSIFFDISGSNGERNESASSQQFLTTVSVHHLS